VGRRPTRVRRDRPGLARHGNRAGGHAFTLTVTDIATGWTENRSVPDKTAKCVLAALNEIWQLQAKLTNYFYPQQKLISKTRKGAKVSKQHDKAATPFHRAINHPTVTVERIVALTRTYSLINPAATQRQIQALTTQLLTITTSKAGPTAQAQINKRARSREATNQPSRAS
jgi:hypothetical protein